MVNILDFHFSLYYVHLMKLTKTSSEGQSVKRLLISSWLWHTILYKKMYSLLEVLNLRLIQLLTFITCTDLFFKLVFWNVLN